MIDYPNKISAADIRDSGATCGQIIGTVESFDSEVPSPFGRCTKFFGMFQLRLPNTDTGEFEAVARSSACILPDAAEALVRTTLDVLDGESMQIAFLIRMEAVIPKVEGDRDYKWIVSPLLDEDVDPFADLVKAIPAKAEVPKLGAGTTKAKKKVPVRERS